MDMHLRPEEVSLKNVKQNSITSPLVLQPELWPFSILHFLKKPRALQLYIVHINPPLTTRPSFKKSECRVFDQVTIDAKKCVNRFKHKSPYVAGWWWFSDVLHCRDVEADYLDDLIFPLRGFRLVTIWKVHSGDRAEIENVKIFLNLWHLQFQLCHQRGIFKF